jgi:uncharacterized protein (TIGR02444 family)
VTADATGKDGFWGFSLRIYARPDVPQACLALQDEGGADVNLVLFLLYLADCGRMLDEAAVAALDQATRDWREQVVKPLRGVRRLLPADGVLLVSEPMSGTPGAEAIGDAYYGLYLLAMGRGRSRTPARIEALLAEAGFDRIRLLPTQLPLQTRVLIAHPARG